MKKFKNNAQPASKAPKVKKSGRIKYHFLLMVIQFEFPEANYKNSSNYVVNVHERLHYHPVRDYQVKFLIADIKTNIASQTSAESELKKNLRSIHEPNQKRREKPR